MGKVQPGVRKPRPETPLLSLNYLGQAVSSFSLKFYTYVVDIILQGRHEGYGPR